MQDISGIQKKYGNEIAAIILCCRVHFGTAEVIELSRFIEGNEVNWQDFIRLTRIHRIRPIVFKIIVGLNLPDEIKSHIRAQQLELLKGSLKIAAETERVILLLKQNDVEAIPYKGIAYSKQFFGDLVSREISDIDLVIRPGDLFKAIDILTADGYTGELDDIYQFLETKYFSYFKDYNFNKLKNHAREFHLELHWGVSEKEIGVNSKVGSVLYDAKDHETLVRSSILTLSPIPHFTAMLVHNSFKDNFVFLKNVVDISQAMKLPDVQNNCDLLIRNFGGFGIRKSLYVSNNLSEQLMGVSLPQIKSFGGSDQTASYFLEKVCSPRVFPKDDKEIMVARIRDTALLQDSFAKKLRYYWVCLQFRFIPGRYDFRFVQLPKPLFFVYYFIKPFRTLRQRSTARKV
jgi:Uncharacterised nucleotidyltransferase